MQTAQSQRVYTLQVLDERGMIYDCGMQPLVAEGERYLSAVYPTPGNQQAVLDAVPEERREAVAELLETGRRLPSRPTGRLKRRWSTASRRPTGMRKRRRRPT